MVCVCECALVWGELCRDGLYVKIKACDIAWEEWPIYVGNLKAAVCRQLSAPGSTESWGGWQQLCRQQLRIPAGPTEEQCCFSHPLWGQLCTQLTLCATLTNVSHSTALPCPLLRRLSSCRRSPSAPCYYSSNFQHCSQLPVLSPKGMACEKAPGAVQEAELTSCSTLFLLMGD